MTDGDRRRGREGKWRLKIDRNSYGGKSHHRHLLVISWRKAFERPFKTYKKSQSFQSIFSVLFFSSLESSALISALHADYIFLIILNNT